MVSDRDKMLLIGKVRSGQLPKVIEPEVAEASVEPEMPVIEGLDFRRLDFNWNPDGTLSKILVEQDAGSFTLNFAWNSNGTVSRITRR